MHIEVVFPPPVDNGDYLTWCPVICSIRAADANTQVPVLLQNINNAVGRVVFFTDPQSQPADTLILNLPADGSAVNFYIGGKFQFPSKDDKDAGFEVIDSTTNTSLFTRRLMVRIRKNANILTANERNRLLRAFGVINTNGVFAEFRNMHLNSTSDEAHGNAGFLPWHRGYLLDLERELQNVDPGVTLPYWLFDNPSPNLFNRNFLGASDAMGNVAFNSSNPLLTWTTDGVVGVVRRPLFNTATAGAFVMNEVDTMRLGTDYADFVNMEGDPHGNAHVSFRGFLSSIGTAAKDPLFFLLHCNVDRLWAKWQWVNDRFGNNIPSYPFTGSAGSPNATRVGHNLLDSMWPWNGVISPPRPVNNPGGTFPERIPLAPGSAPIVKDMIDYQGKINANARLGFDYDDVPYEA